jgi:hypothetical protein
VVGAFMFKDALEALDEIDQKYDRRQHKALVFFAGIFIPLLVMLILGWLYIDAGASELNLGPELPLSIGFVVFALTFLGVGWGSRLAAIILAEDWFESHDEESNEQTYE